jgi:hypothetical protein
MKVSQQYLLTDDLVHKQYVESELSDTTLAIVHRRDPWRKLVFDSLFGMGMREGNLSTESGQFPVTWTLTVGTMFTMDSKVGDYSIILASLCQQYKTS